MAASPEVASTGVFSASVTMRPENGMVKNPGAGGGITDTEISTPLVAPLWKGRKMEVLWGHQANPDTTGPGDSAFRRLWRDRKGWWAEGKGPQGHQWGFPGNIY